MTTAGQGPPLTPRSPAGEVVLGYVRQQVAAISRNAKRARYAAETALPALGGKARRQAADAKKLQELLGDHHDSVVARTVLLILADQARAAAEDTFTYGVMHGRQACQAAGIEQELAHARREELSV